SRYYTFTIRTYCDTRYINFFPTRRSSDLDVKEDIKASLGHAIGVDYKDNVVLDKLDSEEGRKELRTKFQQSESHNSNQKLYNKRSEEHTSELQSRFDLVCRLLLEKKKH